MKTKLLCSLAWVVLGGVIVSANHRAFAQNANPTGPAGYFNQLSTTGGSYDPYTTNATRTIPELSVAGALGDYPLQWSRTMNSRGAIGSGGSGDLGQGGGWTHSYYWAMADSDTITDLTVGPPSYTVTFPDGRVELFTYNASTGTCSSSLGIRERFIPLDLSSYYAYLVLPDGGQVAFHATLKARSGGGYYYSYQALAIFDSNNLATALLRDGAGNLTEVEDPFGINGHWLKIYYKVVGLSLIHI